MVQAPLAWRLTARTRARLDFMLLGCRNEEAFRMAEIFLSVSESRDPRALEQRKLWAEAVRDALMGSPEARRVEAGGHSYVVMFCAYARATGIDIHCEVGSTVIADRLPGEISRVGRAKIADLLRKVAAAQLKKSLRE